MPPKIGPIRRELLEPALYSSGMTAQDNRALLRSCESQALTSRNSQVVFLSEFGETDTASRVTTDDTAMIFNKSAGNVRQIRHRARMKKRNHIDLWHLAVIKKQTLFVLSGSKLNVNAVILIEIIKHQDALF
jgi:hypothetical protein